MNLQDRFNLAPETDKTDNKKLLEFSKTDGGRADAGFKGETGDCVTRAIAVAADALSSDPRYQLDIDLSYQQIYDDLGDAQKAFLKTRRSDKWNYNKTTARTGVYRDVWQEYIENKLGGQWHATMEIGSGCQVHLRADELPSGIIIARVSSHLTTVVDHVMYDNHRPDRNGTRCVYGYLDFPRK